MAQQKSALQSGSSPGAAQGGLSVGERAAARSFITRDLDLVAQFYDSSQEWRRLFSELLGTFLLVLVAAGGGVVNAVSHGQISRTAAVIAPGLMVLAMILFMGAVGGAHLNPAVSLGFALRRDFPWGRVPGYIAAQLVGATAACLVLRAMFGNVGQLGATVPGPGISMWQATLIEALLTFGLLSTILGTASGAQNVGTLSAIAVGAYIALAGLWASPISGASMNPARTFGPALVGGTWTDFWTYVVGPLAGALFAVGVAWLLRGSGGDVAARRAAQGATAT
ncbi:MIP/aquaporin family protein [Oryzihumus leptocrescens]|uniref:Aquaporin Z n=1 Tax=Oryzihumus leptocrescens TaxID=297536 RepID=A0A542ZIR4_9MICO|nr:aquaporin [Oryzihumus leptocrescens]TQL60050.1 aquaporin Z [Oryzihumus leptocrescens]